MNNLSYRLWPRIILGLALAATSVILLTLAFPPYNLGLLIWISFVPMLASQYRILPAKVSSLASAVAMSGWLGVMLVPMFGGKSRFMAAIPLLTGILVFIIDRNKRIFHEGTGYRWFVLEGALGWVGLEMIRGFIPALGTWLFVAYPLWNQPWLIQPLSVFGIFGLDLLIMLTNYVLAQGLFLLLDKRWQLDSTPSLDQRPVIGWLLVTGILFAAWTSISLTLFARQPSLATSLVRVAAIQPNFPQAAHRDLSTPLEQRLALLATQTRQASAQGAQIVVWPEMGLAFDPQVAYTQELHSLSAKEQTYIIIGYVLDNDSGFRNEAAVLAPSGEYLGIYGKTHPAVFSGEPQTTSRGVYQVYDTPLGMLAMMICFDADFTDVARWYGRQGAQFIAVPSLFGPSIAHMPHTQIVFRAIENRTAIVMADGAYNSVIVDPYGRIIKLSISPEGSQDTLIADVQTGTGRTIYSLLGDWLGWLSLCGLVFFLTFISITARNKNEGFSTQQLEPECS